VDERCDMSYDTILYQREKGIGTITLNRSERLNAINEQMIRELNSVLDDLEANDEIRVAIITGSDKAFCTGADLKETFTPATSKRINDLFTRIERLGKPTVAAINGYAFGGGCEITLCCDLRVASETAKIALPEAKAGTIPSGGGTFRLARLVGMGRAKEMLFLGEPLDGKEACDIGLVNRVVPPERVLDEARKIAESLINRPPLSIKAIKECVHAAVQGDTESAVCFVMNTANLLRTTEDYREGRDAFREKRKPMWKGR
jgi:enoyl-CoA hydratase